MLTALLRGISVFISLLDPYSGPFFGQQPAAVAVSRNIVANRCRRTVAIAPVKAASTDLIIISDLKTKKVASVV